VLVIQNIEWKDLRIYRIQHLLISYNSPHTIIYKYSNLDNNLQIEPRLIILEILCPIIE
jgi:hypothetical protein